MLSLRFYHLSIILSINLALWSPFNENKRCSTQACQQLPQKNTFGKNHSVLAQSGGGYYASAMDLILNDPEILKSFVYLNGNKKLSKKFFAKGRLKILVNDEVYDPNLKPDDISCNDYDPNLNGAEIGPLSLLSTSKNDYEFVVFFSKIADGKMECKIVRKSQPGIDKYYFVRTKFGEIVDIKFCLTENSISNFKIRYYIV